MPDNISVESSTARNVEFVPPVNPMDLGKLEEYNDDPRSTPQTADQTETTSQTDQQQTLQTQQPSQDLFQLAKQYGYDDDTARAFAESKQTAAPEQQPSTEKQEEKPSFDELKNTEEYSTFDKQLQQYFGISGEDLKTGIEEFRAYREEQAKAKVENDLKTLQSEWGDNYQTAMQAVNERFMQMPEQMQAALNSVEGARLIYAQLQMEAQTSGGPPRFDRPSAVTPATASGFDYNYSDIQSMSDKEYEKNANKILAAFANGRVNMKN